MDFDQQWLGMVGVNQSHKCDNAPVPYPTIHHIAHFCSKVSCCGVRDRCIVEFVSSVPKWCVVGYGTCALWELWDWSLSIPVPSPSRDDVRYLSRARSNSDHEPSHTPPVWRCCSKTPFALLISQSPFGARYRGWNQWKWNSYNE